MRCHDAMFSLLTKARFLKLDHIPLLVENGRFTEHNAALADSGKNLNRIHQAWMELSESGKKAIVSKLFQLANYTCIHHCLLDSQG